MADRKKKIKVRGFDADPTELAVVVSYETQYLDPATDKVVEKEPGVKKLRVKTLTATSDITAVATELISKTKLISSSKQDVVEQIIRQLQQRVIQSALGAADADGAAAEDMASIAMLDAMDYGGESYGRMQQEQSASMDDVSSYVEMLYEGTEEKIMGTMLILQLTRYKENLEILIQDETLMCALSRVLKDDGVKHVDLAINIVYVLFCFTNFSAFHETVVSHNVGSVIMQIVEMELKRFLAWTRKGGAGLQDQIDPTKLKIMLRKQDKLLCGCFQVLLHLAEDVVIERKMKKKKITGYLVAMLDKKNIDLLIVVVFFLKKLSIFMENKNEMAEANIIEKLVPMLSNQNETLVSAVLRLLYNLSFDPALRATMVDAHRAPGLITKLTELMRMPMFRKVAVMINYHLSSDDRCKSMFTYTDAIPYITTLLESPHEAQYCYRELVALAINLTLNSRNAEMFASGTGLDRIMRVAIMHAGESLLWKVVRNISMHELNDKYAFQPYVDKLFEITAQAAGSPEVLVELLGTLANLQIPEMKYAELCQRHGILSIMKQYLMVEFSGAKEDSFHEDDIILEVVMLVSTVTADPDVGVLLSDPNRPWLAQSLYDLSLQKQDDDEITLQIVYTMLKLLALEDTRSEILAHGQGQERLAWVMRLVDFYYDRNPEIKKCADLAIDMVIEHSPEYWAEKVKQRKFEVHNCEWLDIIDSEEASAEGAYAQQADYGMDNGMMMPDDQGHYFMADGQGVSLGMDSY